MRLDFLQEKLEDRARKGNLRSLSRQTDLIDFVSNDYLGLAQNQKLAQTISNEHRQFCGSNGGTGSRLLSGNHEAYTNTEAYLAEVLNAESVLIFNSGYSANQALVSSVADKGDTILYDILSHVCLKEGAWLSKAQTESFLHNDLEDLEARLKRAKGRIFVLIETIYSMDGDCSPITKMVELCEQYGAYLIVDEAHSTGVIGAGGAGLLVDLKLENRVFARVYTFGKAMGVHGACVAGSKLLTDYLVNFGRSFIYTTSLPPHSVIGIEQSFRLLAKDLSSQQLLQNRIALFRQLWPESTSTTAIQPILIGDNKKAKQISHELQKRGFDVRPILSPTVQRGTERLRISLHVFNRDEDIAAMVTVIKSLI